MKKTIGLSALLVFLLAGCSFSVSFDNGEQQANDQGTPLIEETPEIEMADLSLQVLKTDENNGLTLDNNRLYQELARLVEENPKLGTPNDFTMHTVNLVNEGQENAAYVFLAVNRTNQAMKNMTFHFTMGNTDGQMVWENALIGLKEDSDGILQPNAAIPVYLSVTPEQENLIGQLTLENLVMEIDNFDFEKAE